MIKLKLNTFFIYQGELDKSRQTLEGLKREHGQLNANLDKVNVHLMLSCS